MYDIIIVGAGPAGISAGLYAKRAGMNVLVLYYGESNLEKTTKIDNYYGFIDGVDGKTLYKNGIEQAKNIGIDVKEEEVLDIKKQENDYTVETVKEKYLAKAVIISTGNKKIGDGEFALSEAQDLKPIVNSITILSNGEKMTNYEEYKVNTKKIKEIHGDTKVRQVEFDDGSTMDTDGIFVAIGEAGASNFAKKMGVMLDGDSIIVDKNMQTNLEGLYACGNATGGLLQICKAVYEGAKAGLSAVQYIKIGR